MSRYIEIDAGIHPPPATVLLSGSTGNGNSGCSDTSSGYTVTASGTVATTSEARACPRGLSLSYISNYPTHRHGRFAGGLGVQHAAADSADFRVGSSPSRKREIQLEVQVDTHP